MFIGHFGLGSGAKKAAPAVSLGTLFAAGQFADLLWPTLVLIGVEHVEVQPGATRMTPLNFVSYLRSTVARDRAGSIGLWSLVGFLLVVYLASAFGPPPPTAAAVAWSAQAMWLLVAWAFRVDNHRTPQRN